jgi:carnitine 3-dehydrogenase
MGRDVRVCDPNPDAVQIVGAVMDRARASLPALYDVVLPAPGRITFHDTLPAAVAGAD